MQIRTDTLEERLASTVTGPTRRVLMANDQRCAADARAALSSHLPAASPGAHDQSLRAGSNEDVDEIAPRGQRSRSSSRGMEWDEVRARWRVP